MKNLTTFILGVVAGWVVAKTLSSGNGSEFISLENIRRGIANQWYSAKLAIKDGVYYVRLTGKETDGEVSDGYYPILPSTYEALLQDGIEEEKSHEEE